jgi:hypothetical protein
MPVPDGVGESVASSDPQKVRDQFVYVDPAWWEQKISAAGLPAAALTTAPRSETDTRPVITRSQVFNTARRLRDGDDSDEAVMSLLWHALAWGTGRRYRQNERRINAMRSQGSVDLLRSAAEASTVDPRAAYSMLIRSGGGRIDGLGPSFFTKFLYFAGAGDAGHPCAILDANVARALHHNGWTSLRPGWDNWYTDTYVSYVELLQRWARELSQRVARPVAPDELEYALFQLREPQRSGG